MVLSSLLSLTENKGPLFFLVRVSVNGCKEVDRTHPVLFCQKSF